MRYWHHGGSGCVFVTDDAAKGIDLSCEEITHEEFLGLKICYNELPCRWCDDTGYFYSQADLGYCNCEVGTLKIFEDHKDLLG